MFGIDIGLNVASVTLVKGKVDLDHLVLKKSTEMEGADEWVRINMMAHRIYMTIVEITNRNDRTAKACRTVAIEEPIYSWGRKNPHGFAKSVMLFTVTRVLLEGLELKIIPVNNKTAKMVAGSGSKDKEEMIKAYRKWTGVWPGHSTQYGKETLADSYFIAQAGYGLSREG
jgi:hypothetical protein